MMFDKILIMLLSLYHTTSSTDPEHDAQHDKQEKLDSPCSFRIPKLCRNKRNKNEEGLLDEMFEKLMRSLFFFVWFSSEVLIEFCCCCQRACTHHLIPRAFCHCSLSLFAPVYNFSFHPFRFCSTECQRRLFNRTRVPVVGLEGWKLRQMAEGWHWSGLRNSCQFFTAKDSLRCWLRL